MERIDITTQKVRTGLAGVRDQVRIPRYDSIDFEPGVSLIGQQVFFVNNQNKNLAQTNMTLSGQLEAQQSFLVQGVKMMAQNFYADNEAVLPALVVNSSLEVSVTEKAYLQAPMDYVAGKLSVWNEGDGSYAILGDYFVNPVVYDPFTVFTIAPTQSFRALWSIDNATAPLVNAVLAGGIAADTSLRVWCFLLGIERRRVQ